MATNRPRQPSFMTFNVNDMIDEETPTMSGARSRLPASQMDSHLVDLTPSGEVQMRVTQTDESESVQCTPRHTLSQDNSTMVEQPEQEGRDIDKLRQELARHREAERRIQSLLDSHSGDEGRHMSCGGGDGINKAFPGLLNNERRQQEDLRGHMMDQCYGPSTNPPRQVPLNMRAEGSGLSVQVNRNRCVDTLTYPAEHSNSENYVRRNETNSNFTDINLNTRNNLNFVRSDEINQIKPKRPPVFDGKSSWQDFLVQFEMISTVNKWTDITKAYELATSLGGVAQGIITDIEPDKRLDYQYLVKALTSRFEPENQASMYKSQLNSFSRKPGQTLPEFGQEIRRLAIQRLGGPVMADECNGLRVTELDSSYRDVYLNFMKTEGRLTKLEEAMNLLSNKFVLRSQLRGPVSNSITEQMEREIEIWKVNDKKFVSTRASDRVLECTRKNSCVTVTASSGAGKTATVRHTALILQQEGYSIIPVTVPTDVRDYYQPGKRTVFVVDDMCGNFTASQNIIESWKQVLDIVKTIMADKCCKIILSCRLQVYKDEAFNILSPFKSCECNLISEELYLSSDEKIAIAKSYIGKRAEQIKDISQKCDFFPLLCYLCGEEKDGNVTDFFKNHFKIYKKELDNLCCYGNEGKCKICVLALCVVFNNKLPEKYLTSTVEGVREIIDDVCEACELDRGTSKIKLKSALDTLQQTFVRLHDGEYHTLHDKLFDFLAHYFGEKIMSCLIKHSDKDFFRERFLWMTSNEEDRCNTEFIITLPDENVQIFMERLVYDWNRGRVFDIFCNNNFKNPMFRKKFLEYVAHLEKQQQHNLIGKTDKETSYSDVFGASPFWCVCCLGYMDLMQWMLDNKADVNQCTNTGITPLRTACYNGHLTVVCKLLELNVDINQCDNEGSSPLWIACYNNHLDVVCKLLDFNGDINQSDHFGKSPLWTACFHGHLGVVSKLLEFNVDVNRSDGDGKSPLWTACDNGHWDVVCKLLNCNASINQCDKYGCSSLWTACFNGHLNVVSKLLELNADINKCDNTGCSSFWTACFKGHLDVVCKLLEFNADANRCDHEGRSPLSTACDNNHLEVISKLLEINVDINKCDNDGRSPLWIACENGNFELAGKLLDLNVEINKCDNDGRSPLWIACETDNSALACKLLDMNVDTNNCDNNGRSPLWIACENGNFELVGKLLDLKVDINKCDTRDRSPLWIACYNGRLEVVCKLLDFDVDINKCDVGGRSPFWIACENGRLEVVCKLLEFKVDINQCDIYGCSALWIVCYNGYLKILSHLFGFGADVNQCDNDGRSPLWISCFVGHCEVVSKLLEMSADINLCDNNGRSPLLIANDNDHFDIVCKLLEVNADINRSDNDG